MNNFYNGRDHARALIAAVEHRLGPVTEVEARTRPWASATFVGVRHTLSFVVAGSVDLDALRREIADADLPLHRAFVADIAVAATVPPADGRVRLSFEALVIDEA